MLKVHVKNLQDQADKLAFLLSELFPEGAIAKDVVSVDDFFDTTESIKNDKDIISGMLNEKNPEA